MFCTNCGDLLEDGAAFCTKCGQRVVQTAGTEVKEETEANSAAEAKEAVAVETTATVNTDPAFAGGQQAATETTAPMQESTSGTAPWESQPMPEPGMEFSAQKPKKSSKKWIWLVLIAVLVVILGVILANLKVVANSMRKLVMSPQEYYAYIEKREVEEMASEFAVSYDNSMGAYADISDQSLEYRVDVEMGELVYEMLGSSLDLEDASGLSKIGFDFLVSMKEDVFFGEMAGRLGDHRLISVNALADFSTGLVYAQLPELSQRYISADISESTGEITEALEEYTGMTELYPEGAVLEEISNRYLTMVVDSFENVTEEKDVVTVGEFEEKGTKLCATMTEAEMVAMLEAILTEAKADEELMNMLVAFSTYADGMDAQAVKDSINEAIDEYLANVETYKAEADAENQFTMTIWVNNKGEVIGREFAVNKNEVVISYQMPQKGKEYGYQMLVGGTSTMVEIAGTGTKDGSEMTGEFLMKLNSKEIGEMDILTFTLEHMNLDKWKEGFMDFSCRIKPDTDLYSELGMGAAAAMLVGYELVYEVEAKEAETAATLSLVNGEELIVALDVWAKVDSAKDVTAPTDSILMEDDEDLMTWVTTIDFDGFMENLSQSDMPAELLEIIEVYVNQLKSTVYYD